MIANPPRMICYPPAALNGGPLETAPPKVGEWVWQPKVDDWRAVIHTPTGTVWNQYGKLSSITDKFTVALEYLHESPAEWLDVGMMEQRHDLMRGCIIIFDLIQAGMRQQSRYGVLKQMFPILPVDVADLLAITGGQVRDSVYLINQWENVESTEDALKRQNWLKIQNESIGHKFFEGLVAKRADSLYTFGRKPKQVTPDWIKHRFDQDTQAPMFHIYCEGDGSWMSNTEVGIFSKDRAAAMPMDNELARDLLPSGAYRIVEVGRQP